MYGLQSLQMDVIHPDLEIPEIHFGGRVTQNLEKGSNKFQNILKEFFFIKMDLKRIRCVYIWKKGVKCPNVNVCNSMPQNIIVPLDPGNVDTTYIPMFPPYMFSMSRAYPQFPHHIASTVNANAEEDEEESILPLKKKTKN